MLGTSSVLVFGQQVLLHSVHLSQLTTMLDLILIPFSSSLVSITLELFFFSFDVYSQAIDFPAQWQDIIEITVKDH